MKDILDKTKTIEFLKNVISDKNIELEYRSKLENQLEDSKKHVAKEKAEKVVYEPKTPIIKKYLIKISE